MRRLLSTTARSKALTALPRRGANSSRSRGGRYAAATGPDVDGEPILGLDPSETRRRYRRRRASTSAQPQWTQGSRRHAREPQQEAASCGKGSSLAELEAVAGAEAVDGLSVPNEKTGLLEATPPILGAVPSAFSSPAYGRASETAQPTNKR
ncbi:hypothetical protein THAOC_25657 [Thalassiosira oceanica]|uniref:Uncharacterized protein n=1 Tax=Thalassiosira oceanica TaxID=159749 RepID=K0RLZ2_THAOC|nr:hypothetical protein THAOC_25657 [Thalassiosira oceanica]|eukprot:EJK54693.1 hypothetical protein THAOC_25657 [Thalassiosira oceanica]